MSSSSDSPASGLKLERCESWGRTLSGRCDAGRRSQQRLEQCRGFRERLALPAAARRANALREIERRPAVGVLRLQVGAVLGEELHERA